MQLDAIWGFLGVKYPSFNPYLDIDNEVDLANAAQIRRININNYLSSFRRQPRVLVLGEAPGWRGCRFSGIPFTSEAQLISQSLPFSGRPSSRRKLPYNHRLIK